jgi:hypothetical protein
MYLMKVIPDTRRARLFRCIRGGRVSTRLYYEKHGRESEWNFVVVGFIVDKIPPFL